VYQVIRRILKPGTSRLQTCVVNLLPVVASLCPSVTNRHTNTAKSYCVLTKDEMGGVRSTQGDVEKCVQNFDWEVLWVRKGGEKI